MKTPHRINRNLWRCIALFGVVIAGLLSILGSIGGGGSSEGDDPPQYFADAGPDRHIEEDISVYLDGTGSHTPMGANPGDATVTYLWEIVSAPPGPIEFPGLAPYILDDENRIIAVFRPRVSGEFTARLRVSYRGLKAFDTVTFTSHQWPKPPNSEAGPDQFVKHGTLVTLDGSDSQELEGIGISGHGLNYQWFMVDQPAGTTGALSDTDVVNPCFVAEYNPEDAVAYRPHYSHYRIRLHTIDDDDMVSHPTHVNVYAFPPEGYVYPIAMAGRKQRVLTGTTVNLDGIDSFDVDDRQLTYSWQFYSRPPGSSAALTGAGTATPSFVADRDGVYVVFLSVNNGRLASANASPFELRSVDEIDLIGRDRVVVVASNPYTIPVPDAGPDRVMLFTGPMGIPLDGSGSYNSDGNEIQYVWQLVNAPVGSAADILNPRDTLPDTARLRVDTVGTYVVGLNPYPFELQYDQSMITLTNNTPPIAMAGPDQDVSAGALVNLNGGASSDPEDATLSYCWTMVSAPDLWGRYGSDHTWHDWPVLTDPHTATPSFTTTQTGTYILHLEVSDGQFKSLVDEVVITVTGQTGNRTPVAEAGPDQPDAVTGSEVFLNGNASTDPDGDTLSYLWSFEVQPDTSTATLTGADTETPSFTPDLDGAYVIRLIVNDGQADSIPDTVTVTGQTGNRTPLADAGQDQPDAVTGTEVFLNGNASTDPDGDTLSYLWSFESQPDTSTATLTGADTETPSFTPDLDGAYVIRLIVNDGQADSIPDTVTVTASTGAGACADPLTLITSLPFQPGLGEMATNIRIDGGNLSAVTAGALMDSDAMQATIPDGTNPDQADFRVLGAPWEETSRTHANPISDSVTASFVVRQTTDDIYYKLDVGFTGDAAMLEVRIDTLTGCNCGNNPANCPP